MSDPVKDLQSLCDDIVNDPELSPRGDVSFCNIAVIQACEEYGIKVLRGMTANQICDWLDKNWNKVSGKEANILANMGILCIAGQRGVAHGHVATVYPGAMVYSTKWKKDCPVLANVGRRNAVMGANWAFSLEPFYYTEP